jgi:Uma2 family endonuclease
MLCDTDEAVLSRRIFSMPEAAAKQTHFTREEYLEMEEKAEFKSEYFDGEIIPKAGIIFNHSIICVNLIWRVAEATDDMDCQGFEGSLKLEIEKVNAFVYPDLMVVCGEVKASEYTDHAITNPTLIIEILSPSTETFDRGKKFEYYRTVPSLKEYVLVSQTEPAVESFFKQDEQIWLFTAVKGLDEKLTLRSLEYEIALRDIYHKVFVQTVS